MDLVIFLNRVLSQFVEDQLSAPTWVAPVHPVWVQADELLLEHLVSNLVGNAQDWAAKSGQRQQVSVELKADTDQRLAVLSVADTGPGVSEDEVPHIFNAFFSLKEGGMGMGLAICRSIVEAHHGRIEVSQDPLLGGARFTVLIPLAETV
jgi:two-component system sensor histidine kinase DctS